MKILIIGGVAAGTKAAAKLKRENRDLDITIIAKDGDISYAVAVCHIISEDLSKTALV